MVTMIRFKASKYMLVVLMLASPVVDASAAAVPAEAETMMADARELMRLGDREGALTKVREAAKLAPDWPLPHASLGVLYQLDGDEELSREQYAQVQLISLLREGEQDGRLTREIAEGEALMVYLANSERAKRGMPLLRPHADLAIVARRHSREMRDLRYFSHESPRAQNRRPSDRFLNLFGYRPMCIGENLARMESRPLWSMNPTNLADSHERLMNSASHRKTILWDKPDHIGVGIVVNERGDYWVTEKFASLTR